MARRLGWLGPGIVLVGVATAIVGAYLVMHNRPKPGEVIETVTIDATAKIVVRAEDGGERSFVELRAGDDLVWQALVPPYAGRPGASGIAWSDTAVAVRVVRDDKAEVFALSIRDASKLGGIKLGVEHEKIKKNPTGPVTITDHIRSYEVIAGDDWNQITAIDLKTGKKLWTAELGPTPVTAGEVTGGLIRIEQGSQKRYFHVFTGKEDRSSEATGIPIDGPPPTPAP
ncbi:MAG: PQQ-binding-like beta-propeller repeat protein [Myxococcales bacterium]|nr:PQQ-binding-like beta-propeller repeat protein [Myxococcales bacterium]MBL0215666.1 PQQ-binding-like beta-propeller repeat protein [Myxococcales bacterium]